jgi:CheY-like chemotaxis protein
MNKLIVVIDDSSSTLEFMKYLIEELGERCICFRNPVEAVKIVPLLLPDLVICDYMMFDMDGLQVINTLRGLGVKSKMILYSAMYDNDVPFRCIDNMVEFQVKPLGSKKMKEILATLKD